uniref:Co-chaperonin GroES n=1 Tax=uncultured virus TaxID=340016 RepID=A0A221S4M0_9VIRU|nr:co-chaperonin GroES [uncultured virus]
MQTPAGLGATAEVFKDTAITKDQIAETILHWDVEASGQRLFVAPLITNRTEGGIYIPDEANNGQHDGVVVSAGPLAYINDQEPTDKDGNPVDPKWLSPDDLDCATRRFLKPGDIIHFGRWSGSTVERANTVRKGMRKLMVMNADDVVGRPIIQEDSDA